MLKVFSRNIRLRIIFFLFLILSLWWMFLQITTTPDNVSNQFFAATYGVMALFGALFGISISRQWGGYRSIIGKAILMFSLGLLFQEFGQIAYSYYIYFLLIDVPYPSIGDIGYFGSIPLYIYGTILLARAAGVNVSLRSFVNKIQALIIPLVILVVSYVLFLQDYEFDWSSPLTIFLDFGYPLGQAFYVSIALLTYFLSRGMLGGIMKKRVLLVILALFTQYLADFTFLYQALNGTWHAGGANDFLYLTSYFIMTIALIELSVDNIRSGLK